MLYEYRQYTVKAGTMDQWIKLMDEVIIPFQEEMGMDVRRRPEAEGHRQSR